VPFNSHLSFFQVVSPEGIAAKLPKVSVPVTDSTQYHMAKRHITGAMAAALNLLRALPLNPSKMLPLFAIWAQRTSSPLYSQQTKRNSCRCPFSRISVPSVFQKSSASDFVEI